jgi:hypothetical protein
MTWDRRRMLVGLAVVTSAIMGARWLLAPRPAPTSEREATATAEVPAPPAPLSAAPRRAGRSTADETSRGVGATGRPSEEGEGSVFPGGVPPPVREIPLRVRVFDAASGAAVVGRWAADDSSESAARRARALLLAEVGASVGLHELESPVRATTDVATVPVRDGRAVHAVISLRDVGEYVLWDADAVSGILAEGVSEVVAHLPLRRAIALDVTVLDPSGRPAEGATVAAVWVGHEQLAGAPWPVNADGVARVDRIPWLPGEEVIAGIDWAPERGPRDSVPPPQEGPTSDAPVRTRIPANAEAPWNVTVRLPGPTRFLSDHNESDNDVAASFVADRGTPPGAPRGAVRVRGLGIDGRPVAGATVTVGSDAATTAADGVVTVERVLAGDQPVTARAYGRFPMSGSVRVVADRTTDVEVHEPVGATLEVVVVDAAGLGRTAARLTVRTEGSIAPFDVVDGVQRIDPFTDEHGRRTFARIAPGLTTVFATWGSRSGREEVFLRDGERRTLRVIVP